MSAPRYTPGENEAAFRELRRQTVELTLEFAAVLAKGKSRPTIALLAALHVLVKRTVDQLSEQGFDDTEECFRDAQGIARSVLDSIRTKETPGGDA